MSLIPLPESLVPFLESYLPAEKHNGPFVTLTYAQSLDSRIAAKVGVQTKLSHLETKTMTHYLRSKHDAILVGVNTVQADDPKLNCRYGNELRIRPVVLDPYRKWNFANSQLYKICKDGKGLAPIIIVDELVQLGESKNGEDATELNALGGEYIALPLIEKRMSNWQLIFDKLYKNGLKTIMVEGGATIINELLLNRDLVDSLIITVAPVFLGKEGVEVSPSKEVRLQNISWWSGIQDSVMCAHIL